MEVIPPKDGEGQKVLALDLSTNTGWALLRGEPRGPGYDYSGPLLAQVLETGNCVVEAKPTEIAKLVGYPKGYLISVQGLVHDIIALIRKKKPDALVIEETNLGKNRQSQRILEWIHCYLNLQLAQSDEFEGIPVYYISSSAWRSNLGVTLSKEDKKKNARLARAKRVAREFGSKPDLKKLGIRGKTNKKHVAIRWVNEVYNLGFIVKDNDRADAVCLGTAYLNGALKCDGSMNKNDRQE